MIRNEAALIGYSGFSEENIMALAKTVINSNWSAEQVTDYLVTGATGDWDSLAGGRLTDAFSQIKAMGERQLITISDATAKQWAARMMSGELDENGLRSLIQTQAAGRHTWATNVLDKGINLSDYLAPSRDRIARELEINAEDLDLMDSKVMKMLTTQDPKEGWRLANDAELVQAARQDDRWKKTANARQLASSAAVMLRNYVEGR
jgi:hypothetical protein